MDFKIKSDATKRRYDDSTNYDTDFENDQTS